MESVDELMAGYNLAVQSKYQKIGRKVSVSTEELSKMLEDFHTIIRLLNGKLTFDKKNEMVQSKTAEKVKFDKHRLGENIGYTDGLHFWEITDLQFESCGLEMFLTGTIPIQCGKRLGYVLVHINVC